MVAGETAGEGRAWDMEEDIVSFRQPWVSIWETGSGRFGQMRGGHCLHESSPRGDKGCWQWKETG
jgi:hypothetical protein